MDREPALRAAVLGPLLVLDAEGGDRTPDGELQRRLLTLLLLRRGQVVSADEAVEALWPRGLPRDPAAALQTHVFRLRKSLPAGALVSSAAGYCLSPGAVEIDTDRFATAIGEAAAARGTDPARALGLIEDGLALWRGVPYVELAECDEARNEAQRLGELQVQAREERAEARLALGRGAEAVTDLTALTEEHPLRERPRSLLMAALAASGRAADALRVYDDFRRRLAEELGIEPSAALAHQQLALLDGDAAPPPTRSRPRLPVPASSLIGRAELVARAMQLIDEHRVVTMLGPGGVGKTRLLLEVGQQLTVAGRSEAVVLCELGAADEDSAMDAVAGVLGVDRRANRPVVDSIIATLDDDPVILLLDNCEHVLDPVAELVDRIVASCPRVTTVATSRERLRVAGEHLCPVPPLPLTDRHGPAVTLFVERARAARPDFELTGPDWERAEEIVRRLDGLPLAIELAAARLHTMELDEIATGLDRRFRLLASGPRVSHRHRSLGAAVSWSYELLDPDLQRLFADVSVFATAFGAADAAAISGLDEPDAMDGLSALAERSLVTRAMGRQFGLLETLRAFGAERLDDGGEANAVRHRHAHHMMGWLERANEQYLDEASAGPLLAIEARLPELRTALQWLLEHDDVDSAGRLVVALYNYGLYRLRPDVLAWAELVKAADPTDASAHVAGVWVASAVAAWMRGDLDGTGVRADRARSLVADPTPRVATMVTALSGDHALFDGRLDEALEWYAQARRTADAATLLLLGSTEVLALAYLGRQDTSAAAAALLVETGDRRGVHAAMAWYAAGEAELSSDPALARIRLARALAMADESGAAFVAGIAATSLASMEAVAGDPEAAAAAYRTLIEQWRRAGMWSTQWTMLRSVAMLLERLHRHRDAAVLAGAVLSTSAGHRLFGEDEVTVTSLAARLRAALGDDAYETAIREGAALDADAVLEHALRSL